TPLKHFGGPQWIVPEAKFVQYPDSILYVNTNIITEQELLEKLPELLEAKGIILDLRYYPRIRLSMLTHLLTQQDSLSNCLIKRYIRPGEELPRPAEGEPTWGLEPAEPHIGAKVVALSSRNSQSYCEMYLAVLKHNHLATIVGQPTAGANGNVIYSSLPGDLEVIWTGMLVRQGDGSRFLGVGIIPDVFVKRTLDDFTTGRDAELERALELLRAELD
ncbi:MAG: S41 family peptidase, partial [Candidatus Cloacimonadaceae bacterium]